MAPHHANGGPGPAPPTTAPPSSRLDEAAATANAAALPPQPPPPDLPAIYRGMHEALRLRGADAGAIAALRPWYRLCAAESRSGGGEGGEGDDDGGEGGGGGGGERGGGAATTTNTPTGPAAPRPYLGWPHFLGARCTRLVLVKLDDAAVREVAYAVADEVMREMSGGGDGGDRGGANKQQQQQQQPDHYLARPEELHTTVYHVSHPNSVRGCAVDPDPPRTASAAVVAEGAAAAPPPPAAAPPPPPPVLSQKEWEREGEAASRAVREVAARHPRAALVLERVLLARSGTVLLTWTEAEEAEEEEEGEGEEEEGGAAGAPRRRQKPPPRPPPRPSAMADLRAALRREMPGASPKQPDIMHTTVLRLLGRAGDGDPSLFFPEEEERRGGEGRRAAAAAGAPPPPPVQHCASVAALMERLTARLRGTVRVPLFDRVGRIRLASEDRFATVTHEVQLLPLAPLTG